MLQKFFCKVGDFFFFFFLRLEICEEKNKTPTTFFCFSPIFQGVRKTKCATIFFFSPIFQGVRKKKCATIFFFLLYFKALEKKNYRPFLHAFWNALKYKVNFLEYFKALEKKKCPTFWFFFYALKYAVKWPNFFFNLFALKNDPIFFTIFLH